MCISIIQRAQRNTHGGRIISSNPYLPLAQFRKRLTPSNVTKSHRRPGIRATIIRIGAHRLSSFFPFRETRRSRWRGEEEKYTPIRLGSILCHLARLDPVSDPVGRARGKRNKARGRTKSKTTDSWMSYDGAGRGEGRGGWLAVVPRRGMGRGRGKADSTSRGDSCWWERPRVARLLSPHFARVYASLSPRTCAPAFVYTHTLSHVI